MSPLDEQDDLKALGNLPRKTEPPPELEEKVVAALRQRDLIAASSGAAADTRSGRWGRWPLAAALLIAALGGWIGRGLVPSAEPRSERGREFLVLLSEPNGLRTTKSTPELVGEYGRWASDLADAGRLVSGRHLAEGGRRLSTGANGLTLSEGDQPVLATGFFLIRADSWDEAVDLVDDCPHLAYGGEISLRQIARDG